MSADAEWQDYLRVAGVTIDNLMREDLGIKSSRDFRDLVRTTPLTELVALFGGKLMAVQLARLKETATGCVSTPAAPLPGTFIN